MNASRIAPVERKEPVGDGGASGHRPFARRSLHEGEVDPLETLVLAVVTALAVTEVRWTLHFLPLDGYLEGLALLLAFYFVTGLIHSHLPRHLNARVTARYVTVGAAGMVLVG